MGTLDGRETAGSDKELPSLPGKCYGHPDVPYLGPSRYFNPPLKSPTRRSRVRRRGRHPIRARSNSGQFSFPLPQDHSRAFSKGHSQGVTPPGSRPVSIAIGVQAPSEQESCPHLLRRRLARALLLFPNRMEEFSPLPALHPAQARIRGIESPLNQPWPPSSGVFSSGGVAFPSP